MKTVKSEVWQQEAIKEGHNRVVVPDDVEVKVDETINLDGKEVKVTHIQPVTSGYVYKFPNSVNGKPVNTSKTINGAKYILTFEALSNDNRSKEGKADKATAKA